MKTNIESTQDKLRKGLNKAADIITSSMGQGGSTVIISQNDKLNITKDGVSIAKSIKLKDPFENIGAQLLISAAHETVNECGDGPQPLYSKILTPDGFVTMGSLRVGDQICGTNKTHQKVEKIIPKGNKEIYEVKFMDGRIVECCSDHLWTVTTHTNKVKTLPLHKIISSGKIHTQKKCGTSTYGFYTPKTIVNFSQKETTLDPYLVGLLLGDGSLSGTGDIELSLGINKEYILDKLPSDLDFISTFVKEKNYFRVKLYGIKDQIKQLGLLGTKSKTKYIPRNYLYNTEEVRRNLLQGLLDTDGHINKRGRFEYSTVSEQLYKDFLELTRGLAISTTHYLHKRKDTDRSYSNTPIYRITELKGYKHGNKIVSVTPTGKYTQMQCIKVSNKDSLYITDGYITTHNTTLTSLLLQQMVNNTKTREDYIALKEETQKLQEYIKKQSKKITTIDEIVSIAKTATNSDKVADIFKEIYTQTSFDSHIELERTEEKETTVTIDQGYRFDTGFDKGYEMTDTSKQVVEYDDPNFFISNKPLHTVTKRVKDAVELAMQNNVPLVFVAEKFSREFHRFIQLQVMKGNAKILTLKTPNYGDKKLEELNNLKAYLTTSSTANKIYSTHYYTIIYNNDHPNLQTRLDQLKSLSEKVEDPLEARAYKKMYHTLSGNVATIWVGGNTQEERNELYDRIEDAVGATKTAITHGYVAGMGSVFISFTRQSLNKSKSKLLSIWLAPMNKIITNAGISHPKHPISGYNGWDLQTGEPIDLLEKGIIDPSHTLITALNNALANTKLVLNTKYILYNEL